jgi:hypothetical protein
MRGLRRAVLTAGSLAVVAAVGGGGVAHAAPGTSEQGVLLYRTDEPGRLAGMRVAGCVEPGSTPDKVQVWLDALVAGDELPTGVCAVTDVRSLPARRDQSAAGWVDDRGRVSLGEVKATDLRSVRLHACTAAVTGIIVDISATPVEDPRCTGTQLNLPEPGAS